MLKWSVRVGAFFVGSMMLGVSRELQVRDGVVLRALVWGLMIAVFSGWERTRIRSQKQKQEPDSARIRWSMATGAWVILAVLAPMMGTVGAREELQRESVDVQAAIAAAMRDTDEELRRLAVEYHIGADAAPHEWLTPRYFADAGRYPEVGGYLRRTAEYAAQAERRGVEFTRQSRRSP